jgi:hypothetical protein
VSYADRDEPELCTQPVMVTCCICGLRMQADPIDLAYEHDDAEYVCLYCTRDQQAAQREQRKSA